MLRKRTSYITADNAVFQDADRAREHIVDALCEGVDKRLGAGVPGLSRRDQYQVVRALTGTLESAKSLRELLNNWLAGPDESEDEDAE